MTKGKKKNGACLSLVDLKDKKKKGIQITVFENGLTT